MSRDVTEPSDRQGAHLFALSLGIDTEAGDASGQEDLKRVDGSDIARDRNDGEHAVNAASGGNMIGSVIANNDGWPTTARLVAMCGIKVDLARTFRSTDCTPAEARARREQARAFIDVAEMVLSEPATQTETHVAAALAVLGAIAATDAICGLRLVSTPGES